MVSSDSVPESVAEKRPMRGALAPVLRALSANIHPTPTERHSSPAAYAVYPFLFLLGAPLQCRMHAPLSISTKTHSPSEWSSSEHPAWDFATFSYRIEPGFDLSKLEIPLTDQEKEGVRAVHYVLCAMATTVFEEEDEGETIAGLLDLPEWVRPHVDVDALPAERTQWGKIEMEEL